MTRPRERARGSDTIPHAVGMTTSVVPRPCSGTSPGGAAFEVVMSRLDVEPAAVREADRLLSDAERERANRFVFERDRRRYIVGRARLRVLLAERADIPTVALPRSRLRA